MLAIVAAVILGAPAPMRIASTGFSAVQLDAKAADFYAEYFAQQLSTAAGVRVVTQAELAAVVGLERQRQLLGCAEEASECMAELASALNVDAVLTGSIARVGKTNAVTVKLISRKGELLAQASGQAEDDELLEFLAQTARGMAATLAGSGGKPPEVSDTKRAKSLWPWVTVGTGAAVAVAGGICLGLSAAQSNALRTGDAAITSPGQLDSAVSNGKTLQGAGVALVATGAAVVAAGVVWRVLDRRAPVQPVLALGPDGAFVGVGGAW